MDQHTTPGGAQDRASTRRDGDDRRAGDRRIIGQDRRQTDVPVVIERRGNIDRRASSDRREFERRSGRDRRKEIWPA